MGWVRTERIEGLRVVLEVELSGEGDVLGVGRGKSFSK